MGSYGVLSLLPMVVGIALVLVTKRTAASLLAGTVVGAVILHGIDFPKHWLDVVYGTLSSQLWIWVMLTVGIFGSLVALFERSGGSRGFTAAASRLCGSERRSLLMTWLLSIVVFVDDYLAILSVGSAMKGITDRYRVPREMVAFLICTVSASACVSIPISSWGMFITSQLAATGICDASEGIYTYLRLIPLLFYPLLMVICGGLYAAQVLPVFGPMKRAYLREQSRELVCEAGAEQEAEGPKPHAWNLLLPMAVIVAVTLAAGDAMYGVFGGLIACGVLYIPQKLMTGREFLDTAFSGFRDMLGVLFIVGIAFVLRDINDLLGMPEYVLGAAGSALVVELLPLAAFLISFALGFAAGNFWGICAISMAVLVPMTQSMGGDMLLCAGAIVSGIVASCNACFFASQATLAASASGITNDDYAKTSLPLQAVPFVLSSAAYLAAGFLMQ